MVEGLAVFGRGLARPYNPDPRAYTYRVPIGRGQWVRLDPAAFDGWELWDEPVTVTAWANVPMWFQHLDEAIRYIRSIERY